MGIHETVQIQKQYSDPVHVQLTTLEPMELKREWGEGAERGPLVLTSFILMPLPMGQGPQITLQCQGAASRLPGMAPGPP